MKKNQIKLLTFILLAFSNFSNAYDESTKKFTNDWFNNVSPSWEPHQKLFKDLPNKRCLEIGSYEGRATLHMAENYCNGAGSYIDAVDTWEGGDDQVNLPLEGLYDRFVFNLGDQIASNQVRINRGLSSDILMEMVKNVRSGKQEKYDLIYIDASHIAKDVLMDTVLAWELLKMDGIMIFDDYGWGRSYPAQFTPKPAINSFLTCYDSMYELLYKGSQIHVKKIPYKSFRNYN